MSKKIINEVSYGETFIDPFVNIFKTIAFEAKRSLITLKTMVWVIFTPFPGMIRKQMDVYDKSMEKIDREYAPIAQKINESFEGGDADILGMFFSPGPWALAALNNKAGDAVEAMTDTFLEAFDPEGTFREKLKKNRYSISPAEMSAYAALGIIATNKDENGNELPSGKFRTRDNWFTKMILKYDDENKHRDDDDENRKGRGTSTGRSSSSSDLLGQMQILFYGRSLNENLNPSILIKENKESISDEEKLKKIMEAYANIPEIKAKFSEEREKIKSIIIDNINLANQRFDYIDNFFGDLSKSTSLEDLEKLTDPNSESDEDKKKLKNYFRKTIDLAKKEHTKINNTETKIGSRLLSLVKFAKAKKQSQDNLDKSQVESTEVSQEEVDETAKAMIFKDIKNQITDMKEEKVSELKSQYRDLLSGKSDVSNKSLIPSDKIIEVISKEDPEFANILRLAKNKFDIKDSN